MSRLALPLLALLTVASLTASDNDKSGEADGSYTATIKQFFEPITTDRATLAPDGKHVAYTAHRGDTAYVIIMNVDRPDVKLPIAVSVDRARFKNFGEQIDSDGTSAGDGTSAQSFAAEKTPGSIPFLAWANAKRLVISSDLPEILGIDADGRNLKTLVKLDATDLTGPSNPSGAAPAIIRRPPKAIDFLPGDRSHLLVYAKGTGAEGQYSGTYKVDVVSGKLISLDEQIFLPGTNVLFDRKGAQRFSTPTFAREQRIFYLGSDFGKSLGADQISLWKITPENYLGERAFPLAFDADPNLLYYASNLHRDTFGLYALDLRTKHRTDFALEYPHDDLAPLDGAFAASQLVFDRFKSNLVGVRLTALRPTTRWLEPQLAGVQSDLDARFPSRTVEIIEWDEARARFLVQVSSPSDPGRYYIFFRAEKKMMEFLRLAPELDADALSITKAFEFDTPAGVHLTGYLTQPSNTRSTPPPLLIYCHDGPSGRDFPTFNPDVQALAAMGLVVAQVNYRGSDGFGRKNRDAGMAAFERAPAEDVIAVADWISAHQPIDRKRLAIFGVGFGGYVALRTLQLAPERFRCAITVDAPSDLTGWINYAQFQTDSSAPTPAGGPDEAAPDISTGPTLRSSSRFPPKVDFPGELRAVLFGRDRQRLTDNSPYHHPELIKRPVLILQSRDNANLPPDLGSKLRAALVRQGLAAEYVETSDEFTKRLPRASVAAFAKIEEFINLNVYDYDVKVGRPEVVK